MLTFVEIDLGLTGKGLESALEKLLGIEKEQVARLERIEGKLTILQKGPYNSGIHHLESALQAGMDETTARFDGERPAGVVCFGYAQGRQRLRHFPRCLDSFPSRRLAGLGLAHMRRMLWAFAVCLASGVSLAGAGAATALSWTAQTLPVPGVPSGQLSAVSCPSVRACMAVGGDDNGALTERLTSAGWKLVPAPGGPGGGLSAVSCSSATACTAIGAVTTAIGSGLRFVSAPLVERWNGRRWSIQRSAIPANARVSLSGVSCPARRSCFAVGAASGPKRRQVPLVERWNGSTWSVQRAASRGLRPSSANSFYGVSCVSAKACTAVGARSEGSLVERWNGSTWRSLKSSPQVSLTAVTCTSATACTAVGSGSNGAVAETLNGTKQSVRPLADPGGEPDSAEFSSVACSSAKACLAVGSFIPNSSGDTAPLIERWRHGRWSFPAVRAAQPTGSLGGVSCPARRSCTAVGELDTPITSYTWALHWNGSSFSTQSTPNETVPASVELNGVSCASSTACTAVGQYTDAVGIQQPLAEAWNGTRWSIQPTPNPSTGADNQFNGVSCPTATTCIAVGSTGTGQQLAERWDGARWTILSSPGPTDLAVLNSVSCLSPTACMAVGSSVELWDGARWTIQSAPNPPAGSLHGTLQGVSCTAPTACTAVGSFEITTTVPCGPPIGNPPTTCSGLVTQTLAAGWDGTTWSTQVTPTPTGGGQLNGVSCTSDTACIAVWVLPRQHDRDGGRGLGRHQLVGPERSEPNRRVPQRGVVRIGQRLRRGW